MRCLVLLILAAGCGSPSPPPLTADAARDNLVTQAKRMTEAVRNADHSRLADHTHPALIRATGGRSQYVATVEKVARELKDAGLTITGMTVGVPSDLATAGSDRYAVVPTTVEMDGPDGARVTQPSYLVAASADGGRTWTFVDGAGVAGDRSKLLKLIPNFPSSLALPEPQPPKIVRR